ncbi:MAG: F0F1 ATP synthase subunit epsilon [Limisphaerales bacterium]
MHLKILLPAQTFADVANVTRIVARSTQGSFGILPRRLDCTAAIVPSILFYETDSSGETAIAVDEGVLVKIGDEVTIAVRNAIGGVKLGQFRQAVERQLFQLDEQEKNLRSSITRLESNVARRVIQLKRRE